jgi:type I restriction enzyme S subunit
MFDFPSDWKLLPLDKCMSVIIDYRGVTPEKSSFGIPLVTAKIVKGGQLLQFNEYIPVENFGAWMRRGLPEPGDVVMTTEAPLGEVAQLDGRKVALGQRIMTLRGKPGFLDNTFLKFLMMSDFVQSQLQGRATGTTVLGIKQRELRTIQLVIPPFEEQRAIARILGALDDKIELNRRMNSTLEAMAQAIFKSWFVDFDPVVARSEGQQPFGMNAETTELFPSEFQASVDKDFVSIPVGWKLGKIGDIGENIRCGVNPNDVYPETPYIGLEHMPRKSIELSKWGRSIDVTSNKSKFKKGEILFGKLRPYFHKVGIAPIDGVCSTDILVITTKQPEYFGVILGHLNSVDFINYVDAGSEGTKMPRTNWEMMARYPIIIPDRKTASRFTKIVSPMVQKIHANIYESRTLANIRDALLPRLVSGEVRVKGIA